MRARVAIAATASNSYNIASPVCGQYISATCAAWSEQQPSCDAPNCLTVVQLHVTMPHFYIHDFSVLPPFFYDIYDAFQPERLEGITFLQFTIAAPGCLSSKLAI